MVYFTFTQGQQKEVGYSLLMNVGKLEATLSSVPEAVFAKQVFA